VIGDKLDFHLASQTTFTYMSIAALIALQEVQGKLVRYVPPTHTAPKRALYLAEGARKDLLDPSSAVALLVGRGFVEAALTRWASGGLVHGDKRRGLFLDRLDPPPPEVWEIRVTEPTVQARLIGRFAERDTLILTRFHTRQKLGKKGSAEWQAAMQECEATWHLLFPNCPVFVGNAIGDYVSDNCHDFPI
jgi:hypothetical protein